MRRTFRYLRNQYRSLRRWWAAQHREHPLREFVYLDEVSVFSLISSRLGPVATELTDTASATIANERSREVEFDVKPVKAKGSDKRTRSITEGTQVLRKATIQTTFRELYEYQRESFRVKLIDGLIAPPSISSASDLERAIGSSVFAGWIVDPRHLTRGDLVEVKMSLQADPTYLLSSNIATIADIIDDSGGLIPGANSPQMSQVVALNRILERLMVGLVPLLCRATEYNLVTLDGRDYLVHVRLLSQLEGTHGLTIRPFYIAGVTELNLYWKDVRRILFSQVEYTVLCRVENPAIRDRWTSVKLVDLMRGTIPDMATAIEGIGPQLLQIMSASQVGNLSQVAVRTRECRVNALRRYGFELLQRASVAATISDTQQLQDIASNGADSMDTYDGRMACYQEIAQYVHTRAGQDVDPVEAVQIRGTILREVGLTVEGTLLGGPIAGPSSLPPESDQRILETEIVAIYW